MRTDFQTSTPYRTLVTVNITGPGVDTASPMYWHVTEQVYRMASGISHEEMAAHGGLWAWPHFEASRFPPYQSH